MTEQEFASTFIGVYCRPGRHRIPQAKRYLIKEDVIVGTYRWLVGSEARGGEISNITGTLVVMGARILRMMRRSTAIPLQLTSFTGGRRAGPQLCVKITVDPPSMPVNRERRHIGQYGKWSSSKTERVWSE